MLVLFETAAGYAIFKLLDEKKLQKSENLYKDFSSPDAASKLVKLKHFAKFEDTTAALAAATAAVEGKMSKSLKKVLKKLVIGEVQDELAVADAKLGNNIKEKLGISCVYNTSVQELMRCIRSQIDGLVGGLHQKEMETMSLGLAHSLSRYKLKFSPDKIDTMIIQAVSLLDDLDKELNNYIMRCKEWYGWHFPELSKIVTDNISYIRLVQKVGFKTNFAEADLKDILSEELEDQVKEAAEISMGTEISDEDIIHIQYLTEQVVEISEYRAQLFEYLKNRMMAIAPNLCVLVGETVGARLISHAGSLLNLAKHPASTVQILGAEKALFRALKTKKETPKYGLIYHATLVGQSNPRLKGKISRMLAAKAALACRVDALGEEAACDLGIEHRAYLESRIRQLEGGGSTNRISGLGKHHAKMERYETKSEIKQYQVSQDSTITTPDGGGSAKKRKKSLGEGASKPKKIKIEAGEDGKPVVKTDEPAEEDGGADAKEVKLKKKKKKKKLAQQLAEATPKAEEADGSPEGKPVKKKKKKLAQQLAAEGAETLVKEEEGGGSPRGKLSKKKKKKLAQQMAAAAATGADTSMEVEHAEGAAPVGEGKKKKKKKKKQDQSEAKSEPEWETTEEWETSKEVISTPDVSTVKKEKKKKKLKKAAGLE